MVRIVTLLAVLALGAVAATDALGQAAGVPADDGALRPFPVFAQRQPKPAILDGLDRPTWAIPRTRVQAFYCDAGKLNADRGVFDTGIADIDAAKSGLNDYSRKVSARVDQLRAGTLQVSGKSYGSGDEQASHDLLNEEKWTTYQQNQLVIVLRSMTTNREILARRWAQHLDDPKMCAQQAAGAPAAGSSPPPNGADPSFKPCFVNAGSVAAMSPCSGKPGTQITIKTSRALQSPFVTVTFKPNEVHGIAGATVAQVIVQVNGGTAVGSLYQFDAPAQLCIAGGGSWDAFPFDASGVGHGDIGRFTIDCR